MGPCTEKILGDNLLPSLRALKMGRDGSSNMTMTQNIRPRQQRSGSKRSILKSWSGLASLQTATAVTAALSNGFS